MHCYITFDEVVLSLLHEFNGCLRKETMWF